MLAGVRSDACVSIYVASTPQTQHIGVTKLALGNLIKEALKQVEDAHLEKRRRNELAEHCNDLLADDRFWAVQANSLAVLVTADIIRTYRLPNVLQPSVQVSDRFHLKPLLRSITFSQQAFVLALAEIGPRLIKMYSDLPAEDVNIKQLPDDAGSATGRATVNDRSASGRIQGSEGQKVLLKQYARQIDAAIRPIVSGSREPMIIAAAEPLMSIFRSICTYPEIVSKGINTSPGDLTAAQLADAARPILDEVYAGEINAFRTHYDTRFGQARATADISQAARAATFGAIETLLVDIDKIVHGTIDEDSGQLTLSDNLSAHSYDVIGEVAGRALFTGAKVMGVRAADIPGGGSFAATLRYAF